MRAEKKLDGGLMFSLELQAIAQGYEMKQVEK